MIKRIEISNYTVFEKASFEFLQGLNIIVGENSTGKSLILKLAYSCAATSHSMGLSKRQGKEEWQRSLADKLQEVCKPDSLGRLVSRRPGRSRCDIDFRTYKPVGSSFSFNFATNASTEVKIEKAPTDYLGSKPVFIPTKEVLSVYPGFAAILRAHQLQFDETYLDLAEAVELPVLKRLQKEEEPLKVALEKVMDARVGMENGRFYLFPNAEGKGKIEMPLVAEGIRKIALLTYLVMNGGLRNKSMLFWDEPEVNLNPRLMRPLAAALVDMADRGIQVVLATHSLAMIKEIEIARRSKEAPSPARYFALFPIDDRIEVNQGESAEAVAPIASLEAELDLAGRYLELD